MTYPTNYGLDNCAVHSTNLGPYCADESGRPLPGRPDWCSPGNQWCYVDTDRCTDARGNYMMSSLSSYFAGVAMYYSYGTCGGSHNTFDAWVGSTTECTMEEALSLVETLENYVNSTALTLERSWETYSGYASTPQCRDHKSCPDDLCYECQSMTNWNYPVDFAAANERWRCGESQTSREAREMVCMARDIEGAWNQVAQKEYDDTSRVAFQYFGTQDIGGFAQWPWGKYCTGTYDPRFRPWYSTAASGPKDVVIVVDTSGSMGAGRRVEMAREATKKVIDTLAWTDYATVVTFGSSAVSKSTLLEPMDDLHKANLKRWATTNVHSNGGGTNFRLAFDKAFDVFDASAQASWSSGSDCEKVILFMTVSFIVSSFLPDCIPANSSISECLIGPSGWCISRLRPQQHPNRSHTAWRPHLLLHPRQRCRSDSAEEYRLPKRWCLPTCPRLWRPRERHGLILQGIGRRHLQNSEPTATLGELLWLFHGR